MKRLTDGSIEVRTADGELLAQSAIVDRSVDHEMATVATRIADLEKVRDQMDETTIIPIQLDFAGGLPILGELHVYDSHACVTVSMWPASLDVVMARTTLLHAVKDHRIKVPDSVAAAIDLIGSNPRIA